MPRVTVLIDGREVATGDCDGDETLLATLRALGVGIDAPCNGRGTCGKCKVRVVSGDVGLPDEQEKARLASRELDGGIRLACLALPLDDVTVELPRRQFATEALTTGRAASAYTCDASRQGVGAAVDLGTTTIACSLVRLADGRILASASCTNGQTRYGSDVFTRISHEIEGGFEAVKELQLAAVNSIDYALEKACSRAGVARDEVLDIVVSANCTMTHMLLGINAAPLGNVPYSPAFIGAQSKAAAKLGIGAAPGAQVTCLPHASAFIGGDIVAGALACEMATQPGNVLFIDIGTNGELVLAHNGRLTCTSCAMGPALEGMNVTCGMRAEAGAVEDAGYVDNRLRLRVIGGGEPRGICGSGILALARELVACGVIDGRGTVARPERFDEDDPRRDLIRCDDSGKRCVAVCDAGGLVLIQADIRQVQAAKGALLSGVLALLDASDLKANDVTRVLVAGQFGAHLPASALIGAGLLPPEFEGCVEYVGNTSLAGAIAVLVCPQALGDAGALSRQMHYLDLSQTPGYGRLFARCTRFG